MGDVTESPDTGSCNTPSSPVDQSTASIPANVAALSYDGSTNRPKKETTNKGYEVASWQSAVTLDEAVDLKLDLPDLAGLKEDVSEQEPTTPGGATTASECRPPTISGEAVAPNSSERPAESPKLPKMPSYSLPDWLLEHCVTLRETWRDGPDFVTVLGKEYFDPETGLPIKEKMRELNSSKLAGAPYAMSQVLFEPLLDLVRSDALSLPHETTPYFTEELVVLQTPAKLIPATRTSFLNSVVKQLAKIVNADLAFLALDDVKDFTQELWEDISLDEELCTMSLFRAPQGTSSEGPARESTQEEESPRAEAGDDEPTRYNVTGNEPFAAILRAPSVKRGTLPSPDHTSMNMPTIVYVSIQFHGLNDELFESIRRVLAGSPTSKRTIVLIARNKSEWDDGRSFEGVRTINLLPVRTVQMERRLSADRKVEKGVRNVRLLQRRIRHRFRESEGPPLTRPYASWAFADDPAVARLLFAESRLKSSMIEDVLKGIGDQVDDDRIRKAVLDVCRHKIALGTWSRTLSSVSVTDGLPEEGDRWSKFPARAQQMLRTISGNTEKYEWENHSLDLLVDPVEAEEVWASIAVDEDLVTAVKRVVAHHQSPGGPGASYGILKREHTGGALFYGPPGTGKTLMARVLAHSTDSIVISATAADIQSKWCGEAPKVIKGLFNLARLIAPSIIFIDEADALFGTRDSSRGEYSTFYRSTTTQLLNEMDGFSKSKDTPLVILATNLPGILDPAVLRRVPNITYMGLPTVVLREQIFRIMLRGETLAPDVNVAHLAKMTDGFSGSDIKSLCMQVALACDTLVETGEDTGKRLLAWPLFQRALARATPSAAEAAMSGLRDFAVKFDPLAFQKMEAAASGKAHK